MEDGDSSKKASNEEESDKPAVDEQPVDADNPSSSTRKRSLAEPIAHPEVPPWAAGASPPMSTIPLSLQVHPPPAS
jgi:hypothetical protein